MSKNQVIYRTQAARITTTILPNNSTVTCYTAGTNGTMIKAAYLLGASGSGNVTLIYNNGADNVINEIASPSGGVDIFASIFLPKTPNGQSYFMINAGDILKIETTSTAAGTVVIYGEDF